jgi:hypothetical protein
VSLEREREKDRMKLAASVKEINEKNNNIQQ